MTWRRPIRAGRGARCGTNGRRPARRNSTPRAKTRLGSHSGGTMTGSARHRRDGLSPCQGTRMGRSVGPVGDRAQRNGAARAEIRDRFCRLCADRHGQRARVPRSVWREPAVYRKVGMLDRLGWRALARGFRHRLAAARGRTTEEMMKWAREPRQLGSRSLDQARARNPKRCATARHDQPRQGRVASCGSTPMRWDSDPWLLGCPNGTLDLRTGKLREARREDYITKQISVPFDPAAIARIGPGFSIGRRKTTANWLSSFRRSQAMHSQARCARRCCSRS